MDKLQTYRILRSFALAASIALLLASCASSRQNRAHYPMKKTLNCGK